MRLRFQLFIFMLLRTILNTMHRMVYPFLAVFARSLGVEVTTFNIAGHSVGRALGALLATFIYQQFGFGFVALSAVIFNVFGLLALRRMMRS